MKFFVLAIVFSALLVAGCVQQRADTNGEPPVIIGNPPSSQQLQQCASNVECSDGESCYSGFCLRPPACITDDDCRNQQNCELGSQCPGGYCDRIIGDEVGLCGYAKPSDPFPLPAETPGSETEPPGEPLDPSDSVPPTAPGNETEPPGPPAE